MQTGKTAPSVQAQAAGAAQIAHEAAQPAGAPSDHQPDAAPQEPRASGFLVLHGNRLEDLAETVLAWLQRHPLPGLTPDTVLVQSNGMAEWFKMTAARQWGVCAALQVELPARFSWRAYRQVLAQAGEGQDAWQVPGQLPLDKEPMVWRLMAWLGRAAEVMQAEASVRAQTAAVPGPDTAADSGADTARAAAQAPWDQPATVRLAWAQRVADVFDQYQVYRPDWLQDWELQRDHLRPQPDSASAQCLPLPDGQAWQTSLWRLLVTGLSPAQQRITRPALHRETLRRLAEQPWQARQGLPPRVVLFGMTQLPLQTLELLSALARHTQILLAVPNPCRFDWADTVYNSTPLALSRQPVSRLPQRLAAQAHASAGAPQREPSSPQVQVSPGHPLLSAWGRQTRDFIRQLDRFDEALRRHKAFDIPRIDLFDDHPGPCLLAQLQARVRDLVPLEEQRHAPASVPLADDDRSIQFHVAHSALREVEVLHDRLLEQLGHAPAPGVQAAERPGSAALQPRDIIVMVPDIEHFAPAIRAVFGQFPRGDARHIPWGIADVNERAELPLLKSVEWLLRADELRFTASELADLLELPAWTARWGLSPEQAAELGQWLAKAGLRWGLDAEHRAAVLNVPNAQTLHSWRWALDRLLLGYAAPGSDGSGSWPQLWCDIEPVPGVSGLGAALLGHLDAMLARLLRWWQLCTRTLLPVQWAREARGLLSGCFAAQNERERDALAALDEAMARWLEHCTAAGFDEPVPLAVLREAWLPLLQQPGLKQRFKAGGVTFCTLLPMRAIPFEMVCLLGMNDGEYPRSTPTSTLDLMQLPGLARAGDRSRRDDDRQLMLDAVLSARRVLYVSWVGRDAHDNSSCEPSVLVSQLRDHLDAGWGPGTSARRTTEYPLQPFSRRGFEADHPRLATFAHEWRSLHEPQAQSAADPLAPALQRVQLQHLADDTERWSLSTLVRFMKSPVREWLRHRLGVKLDKGSDESGDDDEPFSLDGLQRYALAQALLQQPASGLSDSTAQRLCLGGSLPWGGPGAVLAESITAQAHAQRERWELCLEPLTLALPPCDIERVWPATGQPGGDDPALHLVDALDGLRASPASVEDVHVVALTASRLLEALPKPAGKARAKPPRWRGHALIEAWVQALACAAMGRPCVWLLVGPDATIRLAPPADAGPRLSELLRTCSRLRRAAQPPAALPKSGLQLLAGHADAARAAFEKESAQPSVRRFYPDFDAWCASPLQASAVQALYGALAHDLASGVFSILASTANDNQGQADD